MKRLLFFSFLAALSCGKDSRPAPPATHPASRHGYSYEYIQAFKQITVDGIFNPEGIIHKLPVETSVYLADTLYPELTAELEKIIGEINAQAGGQLHLYLTRDSSFSNITVYLTDSATYIAHEPDAAYAFEHQAYQLYGYTSWWASNDDTLRHAGVFVDMVKATLPDFRKYVLRHEMTHAIGFPGHVSVSSFYNSVMYNTIVTPYTTSYSGFDDSAIHLLYDPVVQVGMNETQLNNILY